ncbi:hypothetical protein U9M48_016506 [Paspalum notatum var. saurae]|uniref:Uncharacterized protein n=1 Tax=Paspalum notatum var. saurae TaxID=547442 RepID=A0AAQ3WNA1_PASNO
MNDAMEKCCADGRLIACVLASLRRRQPPHAASSFLGAYLLSASCPSSRGVTVEMSKARSRRHCSATPALLHASIHCATAGLLFRPAEKLCTVRGEAERKERNREVQIYAGKGGG